jgi:glycosyltransferase involved in cell wall biosynthesis
VTIHLVYPSGDAISTPQAIGRILAARLAPLAPVRLHAWDALGAIRPAPGDVLVGHPHPSPWTVFRRSLRQPGWSRILLLAPYAPDEEQIAFLGPVVPRCHAWLAITGPYWFRRIEEGPFRAWRPRMVHLDLAVDRRDFPRVKGAFHPPGQRRFLYVGHTAAFKNTPYLGELARACPGTRFGWMGAGRPIEGLHRHGPQDFRTPEARARLAEYDFLLTVGRCDANPTTILEAMAWGLVPVSTPQSGYEGEPGMVHVPLDRVAEAAAVVERLQRAPAAELEALRAANDRRLDEHYHWDRFVSQVAGEIRSTEPRPMEEPAAGLARRWRWKARLAASSPWRWGNLRRLVRNDLRRRKAARRLGPRGAQPAGDRTRDA